MSSCNRVIRGGAVLPRMIDQLPALYETVAHENKSSIDQAMEEAREEGFQLGRLEGYSIGAAAGERDGKAEAFAAIMAEQESQLRQKREAIAKLTVELEAFTAKAEDAVTRWTAAAEERLAGLAVEIASRALSAELNLSRESVLDIVRDALHEAEHATQVRVRVNPKDVATLESHQQEIIDSISHIKNLEISADPSIEAGCCIESESGLVDARVEAYLARLADHVRRAA